MDNNLSNYVLAGFVLLVLILTGFRMIRSHYKTKEDSRLIDDNMRKNNGQKSPSRYYYSEGDEI